MICEPGTEPCILSYFEGPALMTDKINAVCRLEGEKNQDRRLEDACCATEVEAVAVALSGAWKGRITTTLISETIDQKEIDKY